MFPATRIELDDVVLREFQAHDVDRVALACNNAETQRWLPLPSPYTKELATTWCTTEAERMRTSGLGLNLAISTGDGTLLGSMYLKKTQWRAGITEVGYWMAPDARGRGIATMAYRALSTWRCVTIESFGWG